MTTTRREGPKGSFVRWQTITIAQLTYSVNLILGLSVAALGFQVALLLNEKFLPVGWQRCAFGISMLTLVLSIGLGIWCVINRLRDFRATARAARLREDEKPDEDIQPYRDLYKKLGDRAWSIFWWQIGKLLYSGFGPSARFAPRQHAIYVTTRTSEASLIRHCTCASLITSSGIWSSDLCTWERCNHSLRHAGRTE